MQRAACGLVSSCCLARPAQTTTQELRAAPAFDHAPYLKELAKVEALIARTNKVPAEAKRACAQSRQALAQAQKDLARADRERRTAGADAKRWRERFEALRQEQSESLPAGVADVADPGPD